MQEIFMLQSGFEVTYRRILMVSCQINPRRNKCQKVHFLRKIIFNYYEELTYGTNVEITHRIFYVYGFSEGASISQAAENDFINVLGI